jgi:uncharacterized short protein YbdD (DUF466 family)
MSRLSFRRLGANFSSPFFASFFCAARVFWRALREWSGDAAYERYLRAFTARPPGTSPPLSPAEFYVEQLERRYSRPTRCC